MDVSSKPNGMSSLKITKPISLSRSVHLEVPLDNLELKKVKIIRIQTLEWQVLGRKVASGNIRWKDFMEKAKTKALRIMGENRQMKVMMILSCVMVREN